MAQERHLMKVKKPKKIEAVYNYHGSLWPNTETTYTSTRLVLPDSYLANFVVSYLYN